MDGTIEREVGVVDVVTVIADVAAVANHWERHGWSRKKRLWHSIHVVARVLLYEKDLKEARGISRSQNVSLTGVFNNLTVENNGLPPWTSVSRGPGIGVGMSGVENSGRLLTRSNVV